MSVRCSFDKMLLFETLAVATQRLPNVAQSLNAPRTRGSVLVSIFAEMDCGVSIKM